MNGSSSGVNGGMHTRTHAVPVVVRLSRVTLLTLTTSYPSMGGVIPFDWIKIMSSRCYMGITQRKRGDSHVNGEGESKVQGLREYKPFRKSRVCVREIDKK